MAKISFQVLRVGPGDESIWTALIGCGDNVTIATRRSAFVILGPHKRSTSPTRQPLLLALLSDAMTDDKDPVYSQRCWHRKYGNTTATEWQTTLQCKIFNTKACVSLVP